MKSKRQEIIDVTSSLIHLKGYENTKISEILSNAEIGKGQFYHYFSSKRDLGLRVVEHLVQSWEKDLIEGILKSNESPNLRLKKMFDWVINYHEAKDDLLGCPFGNLAIEMSPHDEEFRLLINNLIKKWILSVQQLLIELDGESYSLEKSELIISAIEGAILLSKNDRHNRILISVVKMLEKQYLSNRSDE